MLLSIIIIVKNDRGIANTLKYLNKMSSGINRLELIIVDASNGSLDDIKNMYTYNTWLTFESKKNKKYTIPEQRNLGIKKSKGDIILFIDANCIPDKNWIKELIDPILNHGEKIVAGSIWSIGNNKYHDIKNSKLKNKYYLDEAATMNIAIAKEVFTEIGFFDESFDYGSDVEFTRRAVKHGIKIKYNKNAIVYHDWGNFTMEIKRAIKYGEARINIYAHNKENILSILKKDYISIIYPLYILFSPLALIFPSYLLLLLLPIIKNWSSNPIKTTVLNLAYGYGILIKLFKTIFIK